MVNSSLFQAELEKMLSTIKLLQAKNASTGTISMSKRLMAIHDVFSSNITNGPALALPNGDLNKKNSNLVNPNPCVSVTTAAKSYEDKTKVTPPSNGTRTIVPNSQSTLSPSSSKPSLASNSSQPPKQPKPNSLILVPNQKNIHELSNGSVKAADDCSDFSAVRLVQKPPLGHCPASTKEVQTISSIAPLNSEPRPRPISLNHNSDCPFSRRNPPVVSNKSSDPLSENSDDYLESSVPDNKG